MISYTADQLVEIQKCLDPVTGPEYFLTNYFKVRSITVSNKFVMHDYCKNYLFNIHSNQQSINLLSRQLSKTTLMAGYALWVALFIPQSTILVTSATVNMAKDIMQRIHFGYDNLPEFLRMGTVHRQATNIDFDNGSNIAARAITESACRGRTLSLLMIDELAYANSKVAEQMLASVMPCLTHGGKLVITSSYNSPTDAFGDLWDNAKNNVNKLSMFEATWKDHPDRDIEWAVKQELSMGRTAFRKEHMNQVLQEA